MLLCVVVQLFLTCPASLPVRPQAVDFTFADPDREKAVDVVVVPVFWFAHIVSHLVADQRLSVRIDHTVSTL